MRIPFFLYILTLPSKSSLASSRVEIASFTGSSRDEHVQSSFVEAALALFSDETTPTLLHREPTRSAAAGTLIASPNSEVDPSPFETRSVGGTKASM